MTGRIAVDTGALIALSDPHDQYHRAATAILARVAERRSRLVGTILVLAEFHRYIVQQFGPQRAVPLIKQAANDPRVTWVDVAHTLIQESIERWLIPFADQSFTLTDATTFELMRREHMHTAFAFDQHFVTAGFRLLA